MYHEASSTTSTAPQYLNCALVNQHTQEMRLPLRNTPDSVSALPMSIYSQSFSVIPFFFLILSLLLAPGFASTSASPSTVITTEKANIRTTSPLVFTIPSSAILSNPAALPPSTHATLHSPETFRSAPLLSRTNAFAFAGLTPGSYIFRVHARDFAFEVLRVDIGVDGGGDGVAGEEGNTGSDGVKGSGSRKGNAEAGVEGAVKAQAWQTFLGHPWDNKGELRGEGWIGVGRSSGGVDNAGEGNGGEGTWRISASDVSAAIAAGRGSKGNDTGNRAGPVIIDAWPVSVLNYYQTRSEFSVFSVFKNPMILLALFSMALVVGVPYLLNNMDPETKADFQKMQAESRSSLPTQSAAANQLKDFDIASWLAGRSSASVAGASTGTSPSSGSDKKKK